jgi:two-component system sensor histidine kinase KdpD
MTAVNINIWTLNDAVNRSANTVIRETVPDSFQRAISGGVDVTVGANATAARKIYAAGRSNNPSPTFFASAI